MKSLLAIVGWLSLALACGSVTFQAAPPDSVTGTAVIAIPVSAHIRTFQWSFNGAPYLAVDLGGDSVGPVISSSISLANAPAECVVP
jgi:hypothetical protein